MINHELKTYIEFKVLPKYKLLDMAHSGNHVQDVIDKSLEIAKDYDVDLNMVYTIAAFHDIGLIVERARHHIISGEMLVDDNFIKKFFTLEQLLIMKEAVEDHRASSKNSPRSIYGKIVAEADRSDTMETIIERSLLFRAKNADSFESIYPDVHKHIQEKYGENGYLKVFLETKYTQKMLSDIRALLKNPVAFKEYTKSIFEKINNHMKRLYLLGGPMGVGKTTVGHSLADRLKNAIYLEGDLGWKDIPFIINEENKKRVINNIIEMVILAFEKDYQNVILGWVMDFQSTIDEIVSRIKIQGLRIYPISLIANSETISARLENDIKIGARKDDGVVERSLKRIPRYESLKTIKIDTTSLSINEVVESILKIE